MYEYLSSRDMQVWSFGSDRTAWMSCQCGVSPLPPATRLISLGISVQSDKQSHDRKVTLSKW